MVGCHGGRAAICTTRVCYDDTMQHVAIRNTGLIAAALVVGFLFAAVTTSIQRPCPDEPSVLTEKYAGCVSWEKALLHPDRLIANEQNSLTRFVIKFIVSAGVGYVLMWLVLKSLDQRTWTKKRDV